MKERREESSKDAEEIRQRTGGESDEEQRYATRRDGRSEATGSGQRGKQCYSAELTRQKGVDKKAVGKALKQHSS